MPRSGRQAAAAGTLCAADWLPCGGCLATVGRLAGWAACGGFQCAIYSTVWSGETGTLVGKDPTAPLSQDSVSQASLNRLPKLALSAFNTYLLIINYPANYANYLVNYLGITLLIIRLIMV